jgi:AICAR transformylase/IMP cyclohydrolase PurH
MNTQSPSRRALALISVSDKTGIVEFASRLVAMGFTLLSRISPASNSP